MYYLGLDIGSSSIKAALVEISTGKSLGVVQEPKEEMSMFAQKNGWAEQKPNDWWLHICNAITQLKKQYNVSRTQIKGIGISYQMHGLVVVDKQGNPLRKSIIWCDSRAVEIGNNAFNEIGNNKCASHLLNSPANFTASKLKWVKDNEPDIYRQIYKFMLPGDYVAYKFSRYHDNLIGATHGDGAKQNDLPLLMAEESTEDWAKTKHRHIYTHHVHHKTSKDIGKVNIESIRSASGTDSWHDRNGYRSIKAIEGFLHHPTHGQIARISHIF